VRARRKLVGWKLLDHPGELRHCALDAALCALALLVSAFSVAGTPQRR
jgi:hypothetical protein